MREKRASNELSYLLKLITSNFYRIYFLSSTCTSYQSHFFFSGRLQIHIWIIQSEWFFTLISNLTLWIQNSSSNFKKSPKSEFLDHGTTLKARQGVWKDVQESSNELSFAHEVDGTHIDSTPAREFISKLATDFWKSTTDLKIWKFGDAAWVQRDSQRDEMERK